MTPPDDAPPAEGIDLSASQEDIKGKILENILGKIAGGGVPTEREMRILTAATHERGQGRPSKALRWTVEHASTEFSRDRRALTKKLRDAGIEPSGDGKFSTGDIVRALYEESNPRDEKDREQAENFRLKNQELRGERVPPGDVYAVWDAELQGLAIALKTAKGQVLTEELINEMFAAMRAAKLPC